MSQYYENNSNVPLETIFLFPIDDMWVISKISVEFTLEDGRVEHLETQIEVKESAQAKYEDAVASNQTAVFSSYAGSLRNMIKVDIGNFPP